MFVSGNGYLQAVQDVLRSANRQVVYMAVAFWGKGADRLFDNLPKGIKIRVICNLTTGGTNPQTIRTLLEMGPWISIRQLNDLHAKVICGDKTVVIGSANCSSNGLALQGQQCTGWREAGVVTDSEEVLADVRPWLENLWHSAQGICDEDLELAQDNWGRRRALTNREDADRSIFDRRHGKDYWEGKRVYLAIYCQDASNQAELEYDKIKRREDRKATAGAVAKSVLSFYENWNALPIDATLIDVWYRKRKKTAEVGDECYRRLPALDVDHFVTETGDDSSLQIVQIDSGLGEFPFGQAEVSAIEAKLNEMVDGVTRVHSLWGGKPKGQKELIVPFSALFE